MSGEPDRIAQLWAVSITVFDSIAVVYVLVILANANNTHGSRDRPPVREHLFAILTFEQLCQLRSVGAALALANESNTTLFDLDQPKVSSRAFWSL